MKELTIEQITDKIKNNIYINTGADIQRATNHDIYKAVVDVIKEYIALSWVGTKDANYTSKKKYLLSFEFLPEKFLNRNLVYLDLKERFVESLKNLGYSFEEIEKEEAENGLGNGSLGLFSYAFLESCATNGIEVLGYGIRYESGHLKQSIKEFQQIEGVDDWLKNGFQWEYKKNKKVLVKFRDLEVFGIPYDVPIIGYNGKHINTLRLWSIQPANDINFRDFSHGDILNSYKDIIRAKAIVDFLYPDDSTVKGKELRLMQEFFYASCSIQDIIRRYSNQYKNIEEMDDHIVIHLNECHTIISIMVFLQQYIKLLQAKGISFDNAFVKAYCIAQKIFVFTSHKVLFENMEEWDINLITNICPDIIPIITKLDEIISRYTNSEVLGLSEQDKDKIRLVKNNRVIMYNLAVAISRKTVCVSQFHLDVLVKEKAKELTRVFHNKFITINSGISHRTWLSQANPSLNSYIKEITGFGVEENPHYLRKLLDYENNISVLNGLDKIKQYNKDKISQLIYRDYGHIINPYSIFDMHLKNFHEYRRQLITAIYIAYIYYELRENPNLDIAPRTFFLGGKSAPSYYFAKSIIEFANSLGYKVNNDHIIKDKIKVVFVENYNVTKAMNFIPASDIVEQIATPGMETSGLSAIKYMMNGGITLGSRGGINLDIRNIVGEDGVFMFGLSFDDVLNQYEHHFYNPVEYIKGNSLLNGLFNKLLTDEYAKLSASFENIYRLLIKYNDSFMVIRDLTAYIRAQQRVSDRYLSREQWLNSSLINIGNSGSFSMDCAIEKYRNEFWCDDDGK